MSSKRAADVQRIRERIAGLQAKITAAEDMLVPIEKAYERADALVDDLAERGAIDGMWFSVPDYQRPRIDEIRDLLGLFAWVDGEQIKSKIHAAIDGHYRGYNGSLDTQQTHSAIADDREALFKLEVEEEQLIAASERDGHPIRRRRDADPRAVLAA